MKKPRVRFCWECGKQLWGNHNKEVLIDGHLRILHKQCAEMYKKETSIMKVGDKIAITKEDLIEDLAKCSKMLAWGEVTLEIAQSAVEYHRDRALTLVVAEYPELSEFRFSVNGTDESTFVEIISEKEEEERGEDK